MAFLLDNGFVGSPESLEILLREREVTVTGGMNLARAPWNNPALNGLIVMYETLIGVNKKDFSGEPQVTPSCGMVHGNHFLLA